MQTVITIATEHSTATDIARIKQAHTLVAESYLLCCHACVSVIVFVVYRHRFGRLDLCVQMKGDGKGSEDVKSELIQLREENAKLKVRCLPFS